MNIKNAWLALIGGLPTERVVERPVPGEMVTLYEARSSNYMWALACGVLPRKPPNWHGALYHSCAEAFAAGGPDADVVPRKAIIDENKVYVFTGLQERTLAPKPKTAKGKRVARG